MTQPLSINEFKVLAKGSKRIAVFREVPMGSLTPIQSYRALAKVYGENGVLLEDLCEQDSQGEAYLCFDPMASVSVYQDDQQDPLALLRNAQAECVFSTRDSVANRINSAMGFMAYDIVRYFENIPDGHPADPRLPILLFHFYALSLAFDCSNRCVLVSVVVEVGADLEGDYRRAQERIEEIILQVRHCEHREAIQRPLRGCVKATGLLPCARNDVLLVDIPDSEFIDKIKKAKEHIIAGDAFQIVLSRCFKRPYSVAPIDIYQTLCQVSPSPFMFYFPFAETVILGASPERMLSVIDGQVTVNPIAGTRKRVVGGPSDDAIAADLLSDEKELAEHRMLIDLARNDVGAVSTPGSVVVSELLKVKHYSHVSHITSTVQGQLQDKYDAFDAFAHAFPAGTLSGAPKIRAMEIIDALESSRRGIYGGAICRIDGLGNFDSCIAIRMAQLRDGIATIRVGAGIVYDSNPASEAAETGQKAQSMLAALAMAEEEQAPL